MFFISEVFILEEYFIIETAAVCFILQAFVLIKQSQKSLLKIAFPKKYNVLFHVQSNELIGMELFLTNSYIS